MTGQPPHPPWQPTQAPDSPLGQMSPDLFRHRQFWLRLAAYRPLLVLGGIWLLLMAIAFVAYGRLLSTGSQTPTPRAVYPHQAPPSLGTPPEGAAPPAQPGDGDTPEAGEEAASSFSIAGLSGISLGVMVALCAGGCWVVSRQLQAPPKPRKRRPKAAARPPAVVSPQVAKPGPQRLRPYAPGEAVNGAPAPKQPPEAGPGVTATQVVAPTETTSVDWAQDSLINAVDMRQRRSLSSFM